MKIIKDIINEESGQGMIEYSLVLSLITIVVIGSLFAFGEVLSFLYEKIQDGVIDIL